MKKMIYQITLFTFLGFLFSNPVAAQWWNLYGPGQLQEAIEMDNADLVAGGHFNNLISGFREGLIIRTDSLGNEIWRITFPNNNTHNEVSKLVKTEDGNFLVAHVPEFNLPKTTVTIYKIDNAGNIIWETSFDQYGGYRISTLIEHPETNNIIIGAEGATIENAPDETIATIIMLDSSGSIISEAPFSRENQWFLQINIPIVTAIPGGYYLGLVDTLYKLDPLLNVIESMHISGEEVREIIATDDGNFMCYSLDAYDIGGTIANIFKFNPEGSIIWETSYSVRNIGFSKFIKKDTENYRVFHWDIDFSFGGTREISVSYRTLTLNGSLGATVKLPDYFNTANNLTQTRNGDLIFMGTTKAFPSNINSGFLLRTDCDTSPFENMISGFIHVDQNLDCAYDTTERLLKNYPIQLIHNTGITYYTNSDSVGFYSIEVANGSYQISPILPSPYEISCTPPIVNFTISDTIISADLSVQHIIDCPQMIVSVGTPFLRRCFENNYNVRYCNFGTATAEDSYVEIQLDSFTIFEGSSLPLTTQNGSLLTFDLGDVPIGFCGNFSINTTLSCDAELGQNHCLSARIYPDSICLSNSPDWDGSSVQISAQCEADSVRFFINNIGTGDMMEPLDYIVIQDEILFIENDFQLNSGSSIQRAYPADGSTYRMEADQSTGHPGNSIPSATVEGCGEWPFATGFFGYFPQDDNDPFSDIDCQTNVGSFDPNDKTAFPAGYGQEKFIDPTTQLTYKIRFQNTGTDTAFTVVIRDTISKRLDISTLQMGAASHPYNWRLEDQGVLVIDFPDIQLPDSTTNFVGSNGFIDFKINVVNTLFDYEFVTVANRAGIYFDFNEPVITNWVSRRLGTNFTEIMLSVDHTLSVSDQIKITPNPARGFATLTLPDGHTFNHQLKLYDSMGRQVSTQTISGRHGRLNLERLSEGIYYYGVYDEQGLWASGKIMVQ